MQTNQSMGSLSQGDCQLMDSHLAASLEILEKAAGRPTRAQLQFKSLLKSLRDDIRKATGMPTVLRPDFVG